MSDTVRDAEREAIIETLKYQREIKKRQLSYSASHEQGFIKNGAS
jgi:hypothetical protein